MSVESLFNLNKSVDAVLVSELESLCTIYNLPPQTLKYKWEAFVLNTGVPFHPTLPLIRNLKMTLQNEFEREIHTRRSTTLPSGSTYPEHRQPTKVTQVSGDTLEEFMSNLMSKHTIKTTQAPKSLAFQSRSQSVVDTQFNSHLNRLIEQQPSVELELLQPPIKEYRYMFEDMREKGYILDDHIEHLGQLMHEKYNCEFSNPMRTDQGTIFSYGRICGDTSEGKLNDKSVLLETSRDLGMGKRIRLNLSRVNDYSLFPGQVVAVEGKNLRGDCIHVDNILLPPSPGKTTTQSIEDIHNPATMIVANGPFTLNSDLSFTPFHSLIEKCLEERPNVLLLSGPFISSKHPHIMSGKVNMTPNHLFMNEIIGRLQHLITQNDNLDVILIPHADDMIHEYPLYPQPPLNLSLKHPRIHYLSNPCSFSVNGTSIAVSNIDILARLCKEEIHGPEAQTERIPRIIGHIFQQHTYYPLSPVDMADNIDAKQLPNINIKSKPDLFIIPSQLTHFIKMVDDVVCINAGYVAKQNTTGTFALVTMYPSHNMKDKIRVDIYRL
ncbi:DNA polymerase alpha/epsilon subunit B-domain-containing protein [Pilobolus umbonatus]|nr:DNA polymerase alpha/epsilon subunit B-domain-containing protein [Pilobolus umbonatus]